VIAPVESWEVADTEPYRLTKLWVVGKIAIYILRMRAIKQCAFQLFVQVVEQEVSSRQQSKMQMSHLAQSQQIAAWSSILNVRFAASFDPPYPTQSELGQR